MGCSALYLLIPPYGLFWLSILFLRGAVRRNNLFTNPRLHPELPTIRIDENGHQVPAKPT
ncbi:MAG: hypothetical protein CMO80_04420 [Verrucomicrobiales bacterium]|nr:hypothetical protein [Verrucomicrobiales bacterium]